MLCSRRDAVEKRTARCERSAPASCCAAPSPSRPECPRRPGSPAAGHLEFRLCTPHLHGGNLLVTKTKEQGIHVQAELLSMHITRGRLPPVVKHAVTGFAHRWLHGKQRQDLQQVVLDDVPDDAVLVEVPAAALRAKVLAENDLGCSGKNA